jgi:hypothetical protein
MEEDKMWRMKMTWFLAGLVISSYSQEIVRGTYSYTYGDNETLVQARQTCKNLAVRDAIESYYLFVESTTTVENSQTKEDIVSSIAAGVVQDLKTVDQKEEGRTLSITVEGTVNPELVRQLVAQKSAQPKTNPRPEVNAEIAVSPAVADEETQFTVMMSKFENKMASVQGDWNAKKYDSAVSRLQEVQVWLDGNVLKSQNPFTLLLMPSLRTRNEVIIDLIQKEKSDAQGKKMRERTALRRLVNKIDNLEKEVRALEGLKNLSQRQTMIRSWWTGVCRMTITRVRSELRQSRP